MLELSLLLLIPLLLAWPLGRYMAGIFSTAPHFSDRLFLPVETRLFRLLGIDPAAGMDWKAYARAFLFSNVIAGVLGFGLLLLQVWLPLNPDGIGPLSWDLALHTAVSFLTNTNQQHYSGQAQLSYLSQSLVLETLQFITPAMALAVCVAVLRGMAGGRNPQAPEGEERDLGNYYVDLVRGVVRLLLPLALILALLLASQGVPSTYSGAVTTPVLDQAATQVTQTIPLGPVAAMVAIKQLGTNGGGWYGSNSSNPLENPTPLSNALEMTAIILLPMATAIMAGYLLGNRRFALLALAAMGLLCLLAVAAIGWSELQPNAAFSGLAAAGPNMEGKEVRFGPLDSALWATLTTQTSNGSVNAMQDSLNPIGGLVTLAGMLINAVWGGVGCGFVNFLVYVWIAVFLSGLMIGRTPEIFGRKIETREITWLGILIVLPTFCILGFSALALTFPALTGNSNPGFHGIGQVFYEYTSAFANNGSGFEGLNDNSLWWNLSCTVCLLLGRYLPLVIPLLIAGSLARKKAVPAGVGTLALDNATFCFTLVTVILILNFLSFLPSLVLGPIGEAVQLAQP